MRISRSLCALVLMFAAGFGVGQAFRSDVSAQGKKVYELRTYYTHPGKLEDLNTRFRDHTTRLFEKHGMTNIGYWVPQDEPAHSNTLIYVIAHESREQANSIEEVNAAVRTMDEMTQHNAALVEETNAAIEQTEAQAVELDRIVEVFRVEETVRARRAA